MSVRTESFVSANSRLFDSLAFYNEQFNNGGLLQAGHSELSSPLNTSVESPTTSHIVHLEAENNALSAQLRDQKRHNDELHHENQALHTAINAFEVKHVRLSGPSSCFFFDIRGDWCCEVRKCIFVCKEESELRWHRETGNHYLITAFTAFQPSNEIYKDGLGDHRSGSSTPTQLHLHLDTPRLQKPSKAVSRSTESKLLRRVKNLERLLDTLHEEAKSPSPTRSGDDESISAKQLEGRILTLTSRLQELESKSSVPSTSFVRSSDISNIGLPNCDNLKGVASPNSTVESPARSTEENTHHRAEGHEILPSKRPRLAKGAANFRCDHCQKKFTRSSTLREHARTHENFRPFGCRVCGKSFVRLKDRNRHDAIHSGEKKYACQGGRPMFFESWGCGKKFAREDALVAHFRNEAGWSCLRPLLTDAELSDCFLQFLTWHGRPSCSEALKYIRKRHGEGVDQWSHTCGVVFSSKDDLEFHYQTPAGRKCIWPLLIHLATLDARFHRKKNEALAELSAGKSGASLQDRQINENLDAGASQDPETSSSSAQLLNHS